MNFAESIDVGGGPTNDGRANADGDLRKLLISIADADQPKFSQRPAQGKNSREELWKTKLKELGYPKTVSYSTIKRLLKGTPYLTR